MHVNNILFSTFSQPLSQAQWEVSVPAWFVHASEWLQQWNRLRRQWGITNRLLICDMLSLFWGIFTDIFWIYVLYHHVSIIPLISLDQYFFVFASSF